MTANEMKVYELAKELGVDSISLVDKLKGLNIHVKNHMSELKADEVVLARNSLKGGATSAGASKPAPVKKAVARTRKKTTAEPAAATAAQPTAAPASAPTGEKKSASPVIRRRVTSSDGKVETVTQTVTSGSLNAYVPPPSNEEATEEMSDEAYARSMEASATSAEMEAPTEEEMQADHGSSMSHVGAPSMENEETQTTRPVSSAGSSAHDTPPAAPTRAPLAPFNRPVAPRRTGILKIVEVAAPPPRPMIKPVGTAPSGAPSPIKPAIRPNQPGAAGVGDRTDLFRVVRKESLDQMAEEEAAKKRGGGGREAEIRPEDVRFADYRKKEMVFLPKRKRLPVGKELKKTQITEAAAHKRVVEMKETISVQDFANQMSVKGVDVVRKLMGMGQMVGVNSSIDFDTATLIAGEFKFEVKNVAFKENEVLAETVSSQDTAEVLKPRPPVVTIMGHVDHGKTTLLDSIREANVAAGEAGGITQHIGAYTVEKNGKLITFIDTPGHEAFTVMRARGANVTDIVILVVSADDGVMPQTREALSHAQAAKVPIIVAVNKIDKPGANPEKIKQGLAELNLLAEDWGGDTMFVPVSALKRTNIDKLLESILLQAEVLDMKANPDAPASGTVLEARLEKGRGPVMSVLVSRGTLRVGDPIVAGQFSGKVRALTDDKGRAVKEATPGIAVEILGLEGVPSAGEKFLAANSEADAREVAQNRVDKIREKTAGAAGKLTLEELFSKIQTGNVKELGIVLKGDVFGSVEAIRESLVKLSNEKVKIKILLASPGGITESDVLLASASNAIIIGFNVRPETKARQVAEAEHIDIKCYNIIYELIDDVKKAMTGLLDKKKVEKFLGRAEVRQTFSVPKIGTVAGSAVIDGKIIRGANVRLLRDSRVIFEGKMSSLRRFKDDAKEVAEGYECGIGIENYNDLKPGDIIEAYQIELVTPELTG